MVQPTAARLEVDVRGRVQGVGFRPFVHRLATSLGLRGSVRNRGAHVWVEAEGPPGALARLVEGLRGAAPAPARVDEVVAREGLPRGLGPFAVAASDPADVDGELPPDLGPCPACLAEVADPVGRRAGYAFTSCTACGPRYTTTRALPYDRTRTAWAAFPPCAACRREYDDPTDRRFHVEAQACPACGPRLAFERGAERATGAAALARAREVVDEGGVLALLGVGGWQLACLASDARAVARLRAGKARPHKPLALCARDLAHVEQVAHLPPGAADALASPSRPIVLLPARPGAVAAEVAPGLAEVGVMLPASPLHALLLEGAAAPWVLTSGNRRGEPLLVDRARAREELAAVADAFLDHDRPVVARADDSVVQLHRGRPRLLRRARGFVPRALALPVGGPDVLAVGGDLKGAVCVATRGRATLSPHLGDLTRPEVEGALREAVDHLLALTGARPEVVACDLHPDYVSSRVARDLGLPVVAVQHHHAHAAACLVEHGRTGPALALVLDGAGHGEDGTTWGGELLLCDLRAARRLGRLRPVALPGGDRAAREPWRVAVAHLVDAGLEPVVPGVDPGRAAQVRALLGSRAVSPLASSAGRLFDAVAALCGLRRETTYEGQAAVELEAACGQGDDGAYPCPVLDAGDLLELDTRPLVRAVALDLARGAPVAEVAARFHAGLAAGLVQLVLGAGADVPEAVALTGGAFANRRLLAALEDGLAAAGREALTPWELPPGDGGLSLGQAAVARARLETGGGPLGASG
ncbi:MAG: carbamoyltransferase HypF [Planctomycetes bacterium]|nr:carbamoyltransferase HypF [Planctomycetota bacterium]